MRRAIAFINVLAVLAVLLALTAAVVQMVRSARVPPAAPLATDPADPVTPTPQNQPTLAPVSQYAPAGGTCCALATPSTLLPTVIYSSPGPSLYWSIPLTGGTTYQAVVTNPNAIFGVGALGELYDVVPTDPSALRPGHDRGALFASAAGSPPGTYLFTPKSDGWMCLRVTGVDVMIVAGP